MNTTIPTAQTRKRFNWLEILVAAIVALILSGLLAYGAAADPLRREVVLKLDGQDAEAFAMDELAVGESRTFTTQTGRQVTLTRETDGARIVIAGRDGEADRELVVDAGTTPGRRMVLVHGDKDGEPTEKRVIVLRGDGDLEKFWLGDGAFDEEKLRRHLEKVREHLEQLDVHVENVLSREELDSIVAEARRQAGRARDEADRAIREMRVHVHRLSDSEGDPEVRVLRVPRKHLEAGGTAFVCPHDGVRVLVRRDTEVSGMLSCPVCGGTLERQDEATVETRVVRRAPRAPAPAEPPAPPAPPRPPAP